MENGPFTDDFPIKTSMYNGFSIAMLNYQMVSGISVQIWGRDHPTELGMVHPTSCAPGQQSAEIYDTLHVVPKFKRGH